MATEYFPNIVDFLSNVNVSGILSAVTFQSADSVKWNSTYTTVQENSSTNWTQTLSFDELTKDLSIFSGNTVSLSAFGTGADTELRALSANWQLTYTIFQANSATWVTTKRFDYLATEEAVYSYSGIAPLSSNESDPVWKITRLTFDFDGQLSATGIAQSVTWVERLTTTYN